jgi:dTMP kinase
VRGLFVTFEGIDRCGKSTQARMLAEALAGSEPGLVLTRQPGGSPVGLQIARLIQDGRHFGRMAPVAELMLYLADRAQHVHEVVLPALESGRIVLCDRYADSTTAYQGYGRGLDLEIVSALNRAATGGLNPDLTLYFDIPVAWAYRRGLDRPSDRMEMEQAAFFERVREGYLRIAAEEPERVRILDGRKTIPELSHTVRGAVTALVAARRAGSQTSGTAFGPTAEPG